MIPRILFGLFALGVLGALLYLEQPDSSSAETPAGESGNTEPGYAAIDAELIETDDDGQPLYRLHADRIEQPSPQGDILLTEPKLDYEPGVGNHWTLTAQHGALPQDAHTADLDGAVHAEGNPSGSTMLMRIDTDELHLDMTQKLATTAAPVRVNWGGNLLHGRGMRADLKNDRLQLQAEVRGVLAR